MVRRGKSWGALVFSHNFSDALRLRVEDYRAAQLWDIESSEVRIFQDISSN